MATAKRDLTNPTVQGQVFTVDEARDVLGVSLATVYRYMANGDLRFHKVDGVRVVDGRALGECKEQRALRNAGALERIRMQRRAAAHALHSLYDSRQVTQPARDAFFRRFEMAVDPDGVLAPRERERRAAQAKKAYFTDLARRSSKARGSTRRSREGTY